jgi:hypothetical protein
MQSWRHYVKFDERDVGSRDRPTPERSATIAAPVSLRSEKSNTARLLERLSDRGRATANQRRGGSG